MAIPRPPKKLSDEEDRWYKQGLNIGRGEGRKLVRDEVIDWLQSKYMGPGRPDRGSVEAQAILKLTRELSEFLGHKG